MISQVSKFISHCDITSLYDLTTLWQWYHIWYHCYMISPDIIYDMIVYIDWCVPYHMWCHMWYHHVISIMWYHRQNIVVSHVISWKTKRQIICDITITFPYHSVISQVHIWYHTCDFTCDIICDITSLWNHMWCHILVCSSRPGSAACLACRKRRFVVGGLKHEPLDALPWASPPPPPVSAAEAGAGGVGGSRSSWPAAPGRGWHRSRSKRASARHRRCNVIRWDACAVGWDGMESGGCVSLHVHALSARSGQAGGRAGAPGVRWRPGRALAPRKGWVGGWVMVRG